MEYEFMKSGLCYQVCGTRIEEFEQWNWDREVAIAESGSCKCAPERKL